MNTGMSALNRRIAAMAGRADAGNRAVPDPAQRYLPFPLNDMQQAYWIGRGKEIAGGGASIQYYISFSMSGFDEARFNSALNALVARHDMLRVVILPDGVQQVLRDPPPMAVAVESVASLDTDSRSRRLKAIVEEMWTVTSDLLAWPQHEFRFTANDHKGGGILHCKLDMWSFDGRSSQIFFEELAALYEAPQTLLRPLELRFCDYMRAVWEAQQGDAFARDLAYWKERLKSLPPPPALPMAPAKGSAAQESGSVFTTRERRIPKEATSRILQACAGQGVSLTSFLASVYSDVLSFWSGQRDLTLNFPRFNRRLDWHPDVNDMIGEFASFTLLECRHDSGSSFLERVRQLQDRIWEDLEHASVSGIRVLRERIIQTGQPEMQAMPIVFTAMPDRRGARDALEKAFAAFGEVVECRGATPQVWLDCQYFVLNGELCVSWDSQDHVFPDAMVEDMFAEYVRVLSALADETLWAERSLVRVPGRQFQVRLAQNAVREEWGGRNVYRLFVDAAKRHGERPALTSGATTLSYRELCGMTRRLAISIVGYAEKAAVTANAPACVAVALDRGWEQQAAALGIMAAGLAYLPLDAALPPERLRSILAAASPCLVICEKAMRGAPVGQTPVALLSELLEAVPEHEASAREDDAFGPGPNSPAYVMFTSGSTGVPKGVTIGHDALLNNVLYSNRLFRLGPDDVVFGVTALHHDMSVYDLFGALSTGAHLVAPSGAKALSPDSWAESVLRRKVTFWNSVPAFMEQLLVCGKHTTLASLRTVVLGGDWVAPEIIGRLKERAPDAVLYTVGGPTETTVWNVVNRVDSLPQGWESLPYGRPIANASYYILNDDLADVPDWTSGEMFCGGSTLCLRASLDPEENERAFAVHPVIGETLYRTGDLGRFRPDGLIEILGRKDFQLNISGYRCDPGEVEQAIVRHCDVRGAVVAADTDKGAGGGARPVLTAFVKAAPGVDRDVLERGLRQWVNEALPSPMRPRRWAFLDEFPLTPNGKVDRKALRQRAGSAGCKESDSQRSPKNAVEAYLLTLWREFLPEPVPGVRSSFFELGGDSLKAVRIFARLERKLGLSLSLAQIFLTPTIEELADEIYRSIECTVRKAEAEQVVDVQAASIAAV